MLEYHEKPWPHFTGSLPDDFYNHVKTMWDENDTKKKWNKCKNRSNIIIEDDKINILWMQHFVNQEEAKNLSWIMWNSLSSYSVNVFEGD